MEDTDLEQKLAARFKELPKAVQNAITSADVQQRMRTLADTQKLHLDQWEALENEVMLALLGFQPVEDLAKNIQSEVRVDEAMAKTLAAEISKIVFEPVRQELERELQHPEAKPAATTGVQQAAEQAIQAESTPPATAAPAAPVAQPATPPAPANEAKADRAPLSNTYKPGQVSSERKEIHEDPYRESPL